MPYTVSVLPPAEMEIREAFDWYFKRSPIAARAFRAEVFSAMDRLAEDPAMWPRDAEGVHYYILNRYPYTLHYEVTDRDVVVLAVAHQRRKPRSWRQG